MASVATSSRSAWSAGAQRLAAAQVGTERLQRGDVVIGGVEAVVLQVGDRRDQLVEPRRVLPPRLELVGFVEAGNTVRGNDVRAAHLVVPRIVSALVAQVVDAFADRFGHRLGITRARDRCRLAQRRQRKEDRHEGDERTQS